MTDAEKKRLIDVVYGKDKEAKVLRNLKIGKANAKKKFIEKYPDADVNKFSFEVKLTDEGDIDKYETYFKLTEEEQQQKVDKISHKLQRTRIWNMVCGRNHTTLQEKPYSYKRR